MRLCNVTIYKRYKLLHSIQCDANQNLTKHGLKGAFRNYSKLPADFQYRELSHRPFKNIQKLMFTRPTVVQIWPDGALTKPRILLRIYCEPIGQLHLSPWSNPSLSSSITSIQSTKYTITLSNL